MEHLKDHLADPEIDIFGIRMRVGWKEILAQVGAGQKSGEKICQLCQCTHIGMSPQARFALELEEYMP